MFSTYTLCYFGLDIHTIVWLSTNTDPALKRWPCFPPKQDVPHPGYRFESHPPGPFLGGPAESQTIQRYQLLAFAEYEWHELWQATWWQLEMCCRVLQDGFLLRTKGEMILDYMILKHWNTCTEYSTCFRHVLLVRWTGRTFLLPWHPLPPLYRVHQFAFWKTEFEVCGEGRELAFPDSSTGSWCSMSYESIWEW